MKHHFIFSLSAGLLTAYLFILVPRMLMGFDKKEMVQIASLSQSDFKHYKFTHSYNPNRMNENIKSYSIISYSLNSIMNFQQFDGEIDTYRSQMKSQALKVQNNSKIMNYSRLNPFCITIDNINDEISLTDGYVIYHLQDVYYDPINFLIFKDNAVYSLFNYTTKKLDKYKVYNWTVQDENSLIACVTNSIANIYEVIPLFLLPISLFNNSVINYSKLFLNAPLISAQNLFFGFPPDFVNSIIGVDQPKNKNAMIAYHLKDLYLPIINFSQNNFSLLLHLRNQLYANDILKFERLSSKAIFSFFGKTQYFADPLEIFSSLQTKYEKYSFDYITKEMSFHEVYEKIHDAQFLVAHGSQYLASSMILMQPGSTIGLIDTDNSREILLLAKLLNINIVVFPSNDPDKIRNDKFYENYDILFQVMENLTKSCL